MSNLNKFESSYVKRNYGPTDEEFEADMWVTKDGHRVAIRNMSDQHIRNSINMITLALGWRSRYQPKLQAELDRRSRNKRTIEELMGTSLEFRSER